MILIDTSAWIEFLRDTGTPVAKRTEALLDEEIATCRPVRMELLAGARSPAHLDQLRRLVARATLIETAPQDYDDAAALYRQCRARGETVRKLVDCLIAAHAIRAGVPILHADADFEALERHTPLTVARHVG
jgi:predicted nucleic acid-binding protein